MGPQVRAVGEAQVVELLIPGQRPQHIEVPGHRDRVHVVEQPCRLGAGGAVGLLLLVVLGDLVDECLEAGTARRRTGGGDLSVLRGLRIDTGSVWSDGAGKGILGSHRSLGRPSGRCLTGDGAGDRGRFTDAARVEADDVVGLVEIGRELDLVPLHHLHP